MQSIVMTKEKMRDIVLSIPITEDDLDKGINESEIIDGNLSVGISYERDDDGTKGYYFNIFAGDNYLDCGGLYKDKLDSKGIESLVSCYNLCDN